MTLPRFSRGFGLTLLGMALLPGLSFVALSVATTPPPSGVRVPALDGARFTLFWLGHETVLTPLRMQIVQLDLVTGGGAPARGYGHPSPDGRWALASTWTSDYPHERLRLVSRTDGATWTAPADRDSPEARVWLPDSSGWVEQRPSGDSATTLVRFRVDAPDRAEPALPPGALPDLPDGRTRLRCARADGSFLVQTEDKHGRPALLCVGPNAGPPHPVTFPGATSADWANPAFDTLSPEGDALVIARPVDESRLTRGLRTLWMRPAPIHRTEFLRLRADGAPPERLTVVEAETANLRGLSVAPDGKALVYWQRSGDAHYVPLTR